jgi:hypothetical protein
MLLLIPARILRSVAMINEAELAKVGHADTFRAVPDPRIGGYPVRIYAITTLGGTDRCAACSDTTPTGRPGTCGSRIATLPATVPATMPKQISATTCAASRRRPVGVLRAGRRLRRMRIRVLTDAAARCAADDRVE